ncbi:unnamed protein product [Closterium sp. NIES-65]|nr:unnamed protein product [Closterium sp. NIES-65]
MGGGGRGGGGGRREGSETGTAATGTETAAAAEAFAGLQFRVPGGGVGVGGGDDGTSGSDAAAAPAATGSDAKDADLERGPADVAGMGNSVSARDADVDRKGSARKQEGEGGKGEGVKGEAGRDGSGKEGSRKGEGGVGEGGVGEGGVGEGGVGEGGEGSEVKGEAQGQERGGSVGGRKDAERRGDGGREEGGVSKAEEGGGKETGGSGSGGDGGGGGGSGMLHVFRVDPAHAKLYCQCLSLLGKLFLEHKPRVYTVEGHTFYVLTRGSDTWHTLIGYFAIESSPPASPPPKHDSLAAGTETVDPHRLEAKAEAAPNAAQKLGSSHRVEVEATLEVMQKPAEPHRREAEEKATPKAPQGPSDSHRRDETCTTAANTAGDTGGGLAAAQPLPHEALHSSPSPLPPSPTPPAEVHLSSVVVLPPFQRRGFGRWLLSVAYDMTAARQQLLVPKPPLSDLGTVSAWGAAGVGWEVREFLSCQSPPTPLPTVPSPNRPHSPPYLSHFPNPNLPLSPPSPNLTSPHSPPSPILTSPTPLQVALRTTGSGSCCWQLPQVSPLLLPLTPPLPPTVLPCTMPTRPLPLSLPGGLQ